MNYAVSGIIGCVVTVLSIWFASPYAALRGIQQAITENNAAQASEYIDYNKLRSNTKLRLRGYAQETVGDKLPKIVSGFVASLAYNSLDKAVDAYVTPEMLEKMTQSKQSYIDGSKPAQEVQGGTARSWDVRWWTKRQSLDVMHLYITSTNPKYSEREVVVHLQRVSGLTWKIVDVDPNGWKHVVLAKMRERMGQQ